MNAQQSNNYDEANTNSYNLYEKGSWKELLDLGNDYLRNGGIDFILLRLRMGYASFMLGNYSQAVNQYQAVLKKDSYNETAHYFLNLCRIYLNQPEQAGYHVKFLSKEAQEKLKPTALTGIGLEYSFKATDLVPRGNGWYTRMDLKTRLTHNLNMQHGVALFNQTIGEPKLTAVTNNNQIAINQKEYYNKTTFNLSKNFQLVAAYHYLYTPFNNYIYNNHVGMLGVKYNSDFYSIQADAMVAKLTDSTGSQLNVQLMLFPTGNLNFYSMSTASFQNRNSKTAFNLKQVLGAKLLKGCWIEGNITLGKFSNFIENDALYVYNAIDANQLKAGITTYLTVGSKITIQAGYTFEQRELYKSAFLFNQHSITGGILCKL
jgi:hypothetical protein